MSTLRRIFGYARASRDEQSKSNATQEWQIRKAAEAREDAEFIECVQDTLSAKEYAFSERPEARRLWQMLQRGDVLMLYKQDRLGRDLDSALVIRELIEVRGIDVWILDRGPPLTGLNASEGLMVAIHAAIAQYEVENSSERIRASIERRRADGRPLSGQARFCYSRVFGEAKNRDAGEVGGRGRKIPPRRPVKFELNEAEIGHICTIVCRHAWGLGAEGPQKLKDIAQDLRDNNIKTAEGKTWTDQRVARAWRDAVDGKLVPVIEELNNTGRDITQLKRIRGRGLKPKKKGTSNV